jgi:hypothetical protein
VTLLAYRFGILCAFNLSPLAARRHSAAWLLFLALTASLRAQTKLLRFPNIHDSRIVFTYGGDL